MRSIPAAILASFLIAAGCQATGDPAPPEPSAAAGPALAPAEFRPPAPGSIIVGHREDGAMRKGRVVATNGFAVTLDREGEVLSRVPFCYRCGDPREYPIETSRYAQLWPLEVGKSVTFRRQRGHGEDAVWIHTVSVTGTERIETGAGSFDAYIVEQEVRGTGGDTWRGTRTEWYAPQLGWNVRSEWQASDGESGRWELAAIALAR